MTSTTSPHGHDSQSLDTIFGLLRNRYRRFALAVLSEQELPVSLDELAAAIARRWPVSDPDETPAETAAEIAMELHHAHLPKLAEANLVTYDRETNEVTVARTETVAPFLELAPDVR